jgi:hypothetical protein
MENLFFDFLPDDILIHHIFQSLSSKDIISLSRVENFNTRDELWKSQVKRYYSTLYDKKEWYQQTWHNFYNRLITSNIIPIYYHGDIINYSPFLIDSYDEYLIDSNNITSDGVFVFLKQGGLPTRQSYMNEDKMYEIAIALVIENNTITDKYLNYEQNNKILKIISIDTGKYVSKITKRKINKDAFLKKGIIKLSKYEITINDIKNELFYRDNQMPIYAFDYLNQLKIIDYSNLTDKRFSIKGKNCETFRISELITILAKLYKIIDINHEVIDNINIRKSLEKLLENEIIALNFKYHGPEWLCLFITRKLNMIGHFHDM